MQDPHQASEHPLDAALLAAVPCGVERWRTPLPDILREIRRSARPGDETCLGCAVKVNLRETVYPALSEIEPIVRAGTPLRLQPRDDAYIFDTDGTIRVQRGCYPVDDLLAGRSDRVRRDVQRFQPDGAVLLVSLGVRPSCELFRNCMLAYLEAAGSAGHAFTVGKGHTVQLSRASGEQFVLADYVRGGHGALSGVANNDTISAIHPALPHSHWISVFVALNNALNDLLLSGVTQNLTFYPSYDARTPEEVRRLRDAFARYQERFRELDVRIVDEGPLGFGIEAVGATITGTSDREIPRNGNLIEGQMLIATRPAGDLALLALHLAREGLESEVFDLEALRVQVLQEMLVPNVEAARIIASYLPPKGQPFDPSRHLTATHDMSGPGILAFEELAQDSGHDVYLHHLILHHPCLAEVQTSNPTSGTNGAILIAAHEEVAYQIWLDLEQTGHRPWVVGRVLAPSEHPAVELREELKQFPFLSSRQRPFFQNSRWVEGRKRPRPGPGRR